MRTTFNSIAIIAVAVASLSLFGCTKETKTDDNAKFVGTWNGTSCGNSRSVVLVAGGNGSSLVNDGSVGTAGGCQKSTQLNITVSGNNLTIPSQTFTDNCGLTYTFTGSGSLSGNTLTMTQTVSGAVTASCTFVGTK